ncbi:MAG: chemotaxis response regulator protein-glutamate methylesterase [Nitrospina sp.]|jgi:two-component system chemotaxis response regulator CheB|nr:chemotaxis response regulator protein-glutamate methylesterase [Nitrospina sp.]MBT3510190.1 chemotaxis response regulator protein-glutamate methylesterase [Nitrospina sp.]MBT3876842.1 chemotaxis response regulator protein-glutamate methylesterase [Nitrospina sp.]MBT4048198.1 chemotaxis response regulator protein-glutamate methylesterase [Nitrospina sp.]MBT4556884.1 chemotaxis response regulator protein-glutamate methylesterase [Nitrospina sp.]
MRKIRVLVVDDAVVVRKIVTDTLSGDPDIEVAATAANGKIALQKIPQVNPDILTLDIEMPEMDGLQTLAEARKIYPKLPIIMFSTLTERGGAKTLEALALGATDYVTKPANVGSVSVAMQRIRDELIPKIKMFCSKSAGIEAPLKLIPKPVAKVGTPIIKRPIVKTSLLQKADILAIGVSTGGPNALAELFPTLPGDLPVPIVLVQHMPPFFTKLLAERLTAKSPLDIQEGKTGEKLIPGKAWIAPGDYHMVLEKRADGVYIKTNQDPQENSCRPAVDPLFRSVVEIYGRKTLSVILTGMGQDGLIGCEHVKEAGGQVIVQDEASSVVWGMPGFVARAGLADEVLPLDQIGQKIISKLKVGR